jgi:hypothetical protein
LFTARESDRSVLAGKFTEESRRFQPLTAHHSATITGVCRTFKFKLCDPSALALGKAFGRLKRPRPIREFNKKPREPPASSNVENWSGRARKGEDWLGWERSGPASKGEAGLWSQWLTNKHRHLESDWLGGAWLGGVRIGEEANGLNFCFQISFKESNNAMVP